MFFTPILQRRWSRTAHRYLRQDPTGQRVRGKNLLASILIAAFCSQSFNSFFFLLSSLFIFRSSIFIFLPFSSSPTPSPSYVLHPLIYTYSFLLLPLSYTPTPTLRHFALLRSVANHPLTAGTTLSPHLQGQGQGQGLGLGVCPRTV